MHYEYTVPAPAGGFVSMPRLTEGEGVQKVSQTDQRSYTVLKNTQGQYLPQGYPWWSDRRHLQSLGSLQREQKKPERALKFLSHYMLFLQNSDTSCNTSNRTQTRTLVLYNSLLSTSTIYHFMTWIAQDHEV